MFNCAVCACNTGHDSAQRCKPETQGIKLDSGPLKYAYFYNEVKSIKNIHQLKHAHFSL